MHVETKPQVPTDLSTNLPVFYTDWLRNKHSLTLDEIQKHYLYSPSMQRIVFFIKNKTGEFAECRTMYNGPAKSIQFGSKPYCLLGNKESKTLVIVEDLISAIKVGRKYRTMPLFGSTLPGDVMAGISRNCDIENVILWLDADKYLLAQEYTKKLSALVKTAAAMYSPFDPKTYTDTEIEDKVEECILNMGKVL